MPWLVSRGFARLFKYVLPSRRNTADTEHAKPKGNTTPTPVSDNAHRLDPPATDKRPTPNPVLAVWSLKEYDLVEAREAAWKHVESPLLDKGYRLYWDEDDQYEPNLPAPQNYFAPGPHEALNAAVMNREEGPMWSWSTMWANVASARDSNGRFVVIKALRADSKELEIMKLLALPPRRFDPRNHTIPVLDILTLDEWRFVIMPPWNIDIVNRHPCWEIREYLTSTQQVLEGLAFMHSVGVAHLDIYDRNIRLNHCSHMVTDENGPIYNRFDPQYAYIDFGCSEQFDPTGDPATRRVSSETCSMAYKTRIPEVISGSEFDPFPADVYALGLTLKSQLKREENWCVNFWRSRPVADRLPDEAPGYLKLLDQMTHSDPETRPSAQEAVKIMSGLLENLCDGGK